MVDRAAKLLRSSPEFAELSESVRGQLLDAVKVAAMTATTARIDALNNRLLSGDDAVLETAEELVEDTADMAGDVTGDTVSTVGDVTGGALGSLGRRKRPKGVEPVEQAEERPARRRPHRRGAE
ncbi:hypothetical protein [Rhodococcus sp. ZPP]|uniref:hypothetical protein n=1 Tax=Rhodococcus sp. ZPP TaxID=2749906 RepID=UPI001FCC98D1|nr:hypothetical protein [Rhodococcus sp. ZPP]